MEFLYRLQLLAKKNRSLPKIIEKTNYEIVLKALKCRQRKQHVTVAPAKVFVYDLNCPQLSAADMKLVCFASVATLFGVFR